MAENEAYILRKFQNILKMSQRVKIEWVAKSLGLTHEALFEKLIEWGQLYPFKVDNDMIVVEDLKQFIDALDLQFKRWETGETSKTKKVDVAPKIVPTATPAVSQKTALAQKQVPMAKKVPKGWQEPTPESVILRGQKINVNQYGVLVLRDKKITSIAEIEGLGELTKVKSILLNNNQIAKIEGLDRLPSSLFTLALDNNRITKIEGLYKLSNLQDLILDHNRITKIEGLDSLRGLNSLSLSYNQAPKIEGLDTLLGLKRLKLDHNQITKIEGLGSLGEVTELWLNDNRITMLEGLRGLNKINYLNLAGNPIPWPVGLSPSERPRTEDVVAYCQRE